MRQKSGQEKQPAEDAIRDIRRAISTLSGEAEDPHHPGRTARRGKYCRAPPPRGHRLVDVLWLVEGVPGDRQETACRRDRPNSRAALPTQQSPTTQLSRLRNLTPGPPPFSAMNSTPADSSAERIAASVRGCGDRFPISKSESVTLETPAAAATAAAVIPRPARAIRHCSADMVISLTVEDFLACSMLSM